MWEVSSIGYSIAQQGEAVKYCCLLRGSCMRTETRKKRLGLGNNFLGGMTRQQKKKKKRIRCNNNSGGRERKTHAHNISLLPNQIYADDCHHRQKKKFKLKGYCSSAETQEDAAALCVCVSVLSTIIQTLHKSPSSSSVTPWFFCLIHLSKVEHGGGNSLSHVSRFIIPAPKRLGKSSLT